MQPGADWRRPWRRECPPAVEIRACSGAEAAKGNGLFARESFTPGDTLLEEDPVCGTAILMFDEARAAEHCAHCTVRLAAQPVACAHGCGAVYCGGACRDEALWAHHEVLCPAINAAWAEFEAHARECANEYYVLAARALALLRHGGGGLTWYYVLAARALALLRHGGGGLTWQDTPWATYASRPWWETMRRPAYSSSSSSCVQSPAGSRSGSLDGRDTPDHERDLTARVRASEEEAPSSPKRGSSEKGKASETCASRCSGASDSDAGSGDESLDAFFRERVREQTLETAAVLKRALGGHAASLLEGAEGLGCLVGLLRVNALSVRAAPAEVGEREEGLVRGMAIYALTSVMNHSSEPNCFVASDPEAPCRCYVRAGRPVAAGEELCINYLEGAPFAAEEQRDILRWQYGIV